MSSEFVAALKAEIVSLEQDLEQDVRFRRLRELRDVVLALYDDDKEPQNEGFQPNDLMANDSQRRRQSVRQPSPERERALLATEVFVKAQHSRVVPTREILEHLVDQSIDVGGASPINNLSAMISTSGLFQAHGRRGWTIKGASEALLDDTDFEEIASEVFSEITAGELTHVGNYIEGNAGLPQDIDSRLLRSAREKTDGVHLTEDQRVTLRALFRKLVQNAI